MASSLPASQRRFQRIAECSRHGAALAAFALLMLLFVGLGAGAASAAPAKSVAFLGVQFLNDNEAQEPTTDAERARLASITALFKAKLEASGRYTFISIPRETMEKIAKGPTIGSCGGCEFDYGAAAGGDLVAWLVVQKVSNLILNINVYMADVATKKMTFVHSVDIRGNTDESWTRGLNYLLKNYLLDGTP